MVRKKLFLLLHSIRNNAYYCSELEQIGMPNDHRDFTMDIFHTLPVMHKESVVEELDTLVPQNSRQLLIKQQTSGSTGQPMWIYKSQAEFSKQVIFLWRYRKRVANISPCDRAIQTHISQRTGKNIDIPSVIYKHNGISLNLLFLDDKQLANYYDAVVNAKTVWFLGSPSFLLIFTDYMVRTHRPFPPLRYIELIGEYVTDTQKKYFAENWGCIVRDNYGCRECYAIALECSCGNLHIVTDNVYVEIADPDKHGVGDILITSYTNLVMPFVRYHIGDIGKMVKSDCGCGSREPILRLMGGRQTEYIVANGQKIHSSIFHYIVKETNLQTGDSILKYHVFKENHSFVFEIMVKDQKQFKSICDHMEKLMEKFLSGISIQIVTMKSIGKHISPGGKYRYVNC